MDFFVIGLVHRMFQPGFAFRSLSVDHRNPIRITPHSATSLVNTVNFDRLGIQLELAGQGALGAPGFYTDGSLDGLTLEIGEGVGGTFQLGSGAIPADRLEYDIKDMTSGTVSREQEDHTLPTGSITRTITWTSPFTRCDREKDYAQVWARLDQHSTNGGG